MIEVGDIVRHVSTSKIYEVTELVDYAGLPHALVRGIVTINNVTYHVPIAPEAHALPVPIAHLVLVSKGGIQ
ncbi:MAG: hypothetical protein UY96_C0003G0073 [Parcubacteria group bacterium GW2011_GWB1_56_8]|nr:MAG: hypothetical protein UY96_C0003G0073 [Parcubacteria group bacterium GW2011_GWB1_56_8]